MSPAAQQYVGGAEFKVDGSPLQAEADRLVEARVEDSLRLPASCVLRFDDPKMDLVDNSLFEVGKTLEVSLNAPGSESSPGGAAAYEKVFAGDIVALEGVFGQEGGQQVVVRAMAKSHRLNRSKGTKTYLNMSYSQIAQAVIGEVGLSAKTDSVSPWSSGGEAYVQQSDETAWEFLWRLADRIGFEVVCDHTSGTGQDVHFRKAGGPPGGAPIDATWGTNLKTFRARVASAQQVDEVNVLGWDPITAKDVAGKASSAQVGAAIGYGRSKVTQRAWSKKAVIDVGDRSVFNKAEADELAKSVLDRVANSYVEGTGELLGNPKLKAGAKLNVLNVGTRFKGTYVLSEVTHVFGKGGGFNTKFRISGRAARGLIDLASPPAKRSWGSSIVIGIVTNNKDPQSLARVKVKFPTLLADGQPLESHWARMVALGSGEDRGMLMMPEINDEVLVAFENGDTRRPHVIGSVWNGNAKPKTLVVEEGGQVNSSFMVQSTKKLELKAKKSILVKGDDTLTIDTTGDVAQKTKGKMDINATSPISIKSNQKVSIDAASDITIAAQGTVTIKATGKLSVEATGMLSLKSGAIVQIQGSAIKLG
jgi:phage protein D